MRTLILIFILLLCQFIYAEISVTAIVSCVCEGYPTEAFEVVATGTAGPFTFNWVGPDGYTSDEQNPTDIHLGGEYLVEITNSFGCAVLFRNTLESCSGGIESLDLQVQPNCPSNGGNILTTVTGGELPLQYEWSNGATGVADLYNVEAGTYAVTVTDANGCSITSEVEVPVPENPPFTITADEVGHACNGNDGYIVLNMTGIAEPYTVQWSLPGETEHRISDLSNGTYAVTITDANGCSGTETFAILGAPSFNHFVFPETCEAANDGRIELVANSNPAPEEVTITWSDGITNELIRTGLDAGLYAVTITGNESGCSVIKDNLSTHPTDNSGEAPYLQSLRIFASHNGSEIPIYKGDWIESPAGCVEFQGGSQNLDQTLIDAMGNGEVVWTVFAIYNQIVNTGSLAFTSQEGSLPPIFIFETSNEHTFTLGTTQVSTLIGMSGSFDLVIESFAASPVGGPTLNMYDYSSGLTNCVDISSINPLTCEYEPPLNPAYVGTDPTHRFSFDCLEASMIGDIDNYTFCVDIGDTPIDSVLSVSWQFNGVAVPTSGTDLCFQFADDAFGEYCATVKINLETGACVVEVCGNYCAPPANLNVVEDVTQPSCTSATDGAICLEIQPDTAPLLITWETGEVESCIENLAVGTYSYILSPGNGCDLMRGFPETDDIDLGIDNSAINIIENLTPSCSSGLTLGTGVACIYAYGGASPYDIMWDDGTVANCREDLVPGEYAYTLTDACVARVEGTAIIEAIESAAITVTLPGPDATACVSHFQLYVSSPASLIITITNDETGGRFSRTVPPTGNLPYLVLFEGIPPGSYTVEIRDQCRNLLQSFDEQLVPDLDVHLIEGIRHHDFIRCEGDAGMLTVVIAEDEGTSPYAILWSNGETTETIENLQAGTVYMVTVTDANGCETTHGLTMSDRNVLSLSAEVSGACSGVDGAIDLTIEGGYRPYTFEWNNGESTEDIENLSSGVFYCVTVTDSENCVIEECFSINQADFEIANTSIKNHECGAGEGCNGSIDLQVNSSLPVTYAWSNGATTQDVLGLCVGQYQVTITSGECNEIMTFEVEGTEYDDWDFSYEVESGFYDNSTLSNDAEVSIFSELFNDHFFGSELVVSYNIGMSPSIVPSPTFRSGTDGRRIDIRIDEIYSIYQRFYLTYTTEDGCTYRGRIQITNCTSDEIVGIDFDLVPDGDETQSCEPGQTYSYDIYITDIGDNFPFYLNVSMESPSYPEDTDYRQTIVIEENYETPIRVTGVPPGVAKFHAFHVCGTNPSTARIVTHSNCCLRLTSCAYERSGTHNVNGGGEYFDFPYFRLTTYQECFENDCGSFSGNNCSNIEITHSSTTPLSNCWTGTITIEYPEESQVNPLVLAVVDGEGAADEIILISGDDNWMPPGAGFFDISITYTGNGSSLGQDCTTTFQAEFFGGPHTNIVIGFFDDFGFPRLGDAPSEFRESYYRTYLCDYCGNLELTGENTDYLWGSPLTECDGPSLNPYDSDAYFRLTPYSFNDPCNSGGVLTIYRYDEEVGIPVHTTIHIPPTAEGEPPNPSETAVPPLWLEQGQWCYRSGWCLFDFMDVYGFPSIDGKRLLASWADPDFCGPLPHPEVPDPNVPPCNDETNPCPGELQCVDGGCLDLCEDDDDCIYGGTCVDGVCVELDPPPGSDECVPSCPEGFECINNECIPTDDICEVTVTENENLTFTYYHNLPSGTQIEFLYRGFDPANTFRVRVGGSEEVILCAENWTWESRILEVVGNSVIVAVEACGDNDASLYNFRIRCPGSFDGIPPINGGDDEDGNISVFPNPFTEALTLTTSSVDEAFEGSIVLLDFQGGEISRQTANFESGQNTVDINTPNNLAPGIYTVFVLKNGLIFGSTRVVKM